MTPKTFLMTWGGRPSPGGSWTPQLAPGPSCRLSTVAQGPRWRGITLFWQISFGNLSDFEAVCNCLVDYLVTEVFDERLSHKEDTDKAWRKLLLTFYYWKLVSRLRDSSADILCGKINPLSYLHNKSYCHNSWIQGRSGLGWWTYPIWFLWFKYIYYFTNLKKTDNP